MARTQTPGRKAREELRREKLTKNLPQDPRSLLNAAEAAKMLGLSIHYIRKLSSHKNGNPPQIPYIKIGRSIRFDSEQLRKWVKERQYCPSGKKGKHEAFDNILFIGQPSLSEQNHTSNIPSAYQNCFEGRQKTEASNEASIAEILASCDN